MNKILIIIFISFGILFQPKASKHPIKINLQIRNQFGTLEHGVLFIYDNDILVYNGNFSKNGKVSVNLVQDKTYLLVISNPGHVSSHITLSTEKMLPDEVSKIFIDCKLYNVAARNIDFSMVNYKVKWNYITERFEYFNLNFGWIEEIQEEDKQKKSE